MNNDYIQKMQRGRITRKLLIQYFIALAIYAGLMILGILLCAEFVGRFTWYAENPLYQILQFIKSNVYIFVFLIFFIGWVLISYYFISKPLKYVDQLAAAAKQLTVSANEPVILVPALYETEAELNAVRLAAQNNAAAAAEAEQRKNDLIVYLAHDLKTPLTSVIGYLTLLRDEPMISGELRAKYTGIALDKAERLEELINEFFDITRFNLTHIELELEYANLTMMLEQIAFEFLPVLEEKQLTISMHAAPDINVLCDPEKLLRVFDNLLRNAVNYSYRETEIKVSLEVVQGYAVIRVKNHGKTIPSEKLSRIFDQFFRLDHSRTSSTGGAGLGLAIAKEIIERHGGQISAESAEESIIFTVKMPMS